MALSKQTEAQLLSIQPYLVLHSHPGFWSSLSTDWV